MRRKIFALLLAFCMIFGVVPVFNAAALDQTLPTIHVTDISGQVGNIVTVDINLENPQDTTGFQFDLAYNSAYLEPVLVENAQGVSVPKADPGSIGSLLETNVTPEGTIGIASAGTQTATGDAVQLCRLYFELKAAGISSLQLQAAGLFNSEGDEINCSLI
ncbi:MAG: cohesin domain-containing protein, partial [Syntrophomonas sp.]